MNGSSRGELSQQRINLYGRHSAPQNHSKIIWHVLKIKKSSYDYLCPILTLFGIFILKTLNRSSLRFGGFADKSVQK